MNQRMCQTFVYEPRWGSDNLGPGLIALVARWSILHRSPLAPWNSLVPSLFVHVSTDRHFRLSNGGEYLFQARDDREMSEWVEAINASSGGEAAGSSSRAQTLPAEGATAKGEKKGFFTLGKGSKK